MGSRPPRAFLCFCLGLESPSFDNLAESGLGLVSRAMSTSSEGWSGRASTGVGLMFVSLTTSVSLPTSFFCCDSRSDVAGTTGRLSANIP